MKQGRSDSTPAMRQSCAHGLMLLSINATIGSGIATTTSFSNRIRILMSPRSLGIQFFQKHLFSNEVAVLARCLFHRVHSQKEVGSRVVASHKYAIPSLAVSVSGFANQLAGLVIKFPCS